MFNNICELCPKFKDLPNEAKFIWLFTNEDISVLHHTSSVTEMLQTLNWPTLEKRRIIIIIMLLFQLRAPEEAESYI
jgi:hypothetical protein